MIKSFWRWLTTERPTCDYLWCDYYKAPVSRCPNGHRLPAGVNGAPTSPRPFLGKVKKEKSDD